MKNLYLIVSVVIIVILGVFLIKQPTVTKTKFTQIPIGSIVPVSMQVDINNSRTTAIVLAAKKVSPAVVSITVIQERVVTAFDPFSDPFWGDFFRNFTPRQQYKQQIQGLGSGVIINEQGDIVTNAHVVESATKMKVTLPDNRQFDGELVDIDRNQDLAVIKIKGKDLPYANLGNSDDIMIGEWCIAFGNPFGFLLEDAQPSISVGVISALNRNMKPGESGGREYKNMIQTDASINPGNSGGALANALGEIIGINTFIFTHSGGSEGIGFAIPVDEVKKFIAQTKDHTKNMVSEDKIEKIKTKIGVTVSDNNYTLMRKYNLTSENGVVVVDLEDNSVGSMLGIAIGDIIVSINNQKPKDASGFQKLAASSSKQLEMVVARQGEQIRIFYHY
jgi:serine protease Do